MPDPHKIADLGSNPRGPTITRSNSMFIDIFKNISYQTLCSIINREGIHDKLRKLSNPVFESFYNCENQNVYEIEEGIFELDDFHFKLICYHEENSCDKCGDFESIIIGKHDICLNTIFSSGLVCVKKLKYFSTQSITAYLLPEQIEISKLEDLFKGTYLVI